MKKIGFTIIEVSLVISIAGLIFLMVFIALPSLRASQRDTDRRESVITLVREIKNYQSNNGRGNLPGTSDTPPLQIVGDSLATYDSINKPTSWANFYQSYFGDSFIDPSGNKYNFVIVECGTKTPDADCLSNAQSEVFKLSTLYNSSFPNNYNMYIVLGATCSGEKAVATSNSRKVAVLYRLEGSGIYCDNT